MSQTDSPAPEAAASPPKHSKMRGQPFYTAAFTLSTVIFVGLLLLPLQRSSRPTARRSQCKNNLKQIGLALHNYHDAFGCFPPAYIADAEGRPMHSWRVLLLPYLDQAPLYQKYRFDEPWNGPHNRQLAETAVTVFNCPSEEHDPKSGSRYHTSYVAVIGPETMWSGEQPVKISDVSDGLSNTLLVVEVSNSGIHWMEPRDLHISQMASTINPAAGQGISSKHTSGAQVLFGDGYVRFISAELSVESLRALLSRGGKDDPGEF